MLYLCEWMAPSRAFYEGSDGHQGTHPITQGSVVWENFVSSPSLTRNLGWGRSWPRSRFNVV